MKVGILTCHDSINHGSFLQAYCLQEALKKLGLEVKIINYKSRHQHLKEHQAFLGSFSSYLNPILYLKHKELRRRVLNFSKIQKFKKNHKLFNLTRFSHQVINASRDEDFDLVVLGSDEIWNFKNDFLGLDLTYFGQGISARKIISYAPSFGQVTSADKIPQEVFDCLQKLSAISVRDENSLRILKTHSLNAIKVLDPTFLHEVKIPHTYNSLSNYVLIYMTYAEGEDISYFQEYAKKRQKKLIAIGYEHSWCDLSFVNIDVFEWLNFFRNADTIFTNSFHGSIYSILNRKDFYVVRPTAKSNKINNLLNDLGLSSRIVNQLKDLSQIQGQILSYDEVEKAIKTYKQKSFDYLYWALNSDEVD